MLLTPAVVVPATLATWIESLRLGVAEAQAGKTRPAREVFAELGIDLDAEDD